MFDRILIANRGEIACRVIATARRLGIETVAVFSDADAGALHVARADRAVRIGAPPPRESYLRIDRIVAAARATGAQAIHPGYGFLSENAEFAEACAAAGLVFVGPPPEAIRAMGSKAESKARMQAAGVPLVPGYHGAGQDPALLAVEAERIGYPVLIKASAGGGGKGMRVVETPAGFAEALGAAKREAASAFGDERVLIERYLTRPRHIEIQVFGDTQGRIVSLFERDCSIQRRHQKVIEEAPAPGMEPARRAAMGEAAVRAAQAVGYVGAGTVEFIAEGGEFYFMEMNTRLQVEHPVTEAVIGLDLVEWQFRVAAGEPLPEPPATPRGHAIEARLYAEDPSRDFLPSIGTITHWREPASARVDTGVREGDAVTPFYDPMIAKIIAHGETRADAVRRLRAALAATELGGVRHNLPLLRAIAAHPEFAAGTFDTGFIPRHADTLLAEPALDAPARRVVLAAVALALLQARQGAAPPADPWDAADAWRLNGDGFQDLVLDLATETVALRLHPRAHGALLDLPGGPAEARLETHPEGSVLWLEGVPHSLRLREAPGGWTVFLHGSGHTVSVRDPLAPPETAAAGDDRLAAPIPARVTRVLVSAGDPVARGAPLVVLEAMKMELTLSAPASGTVRALRCAVGDMVAEGAELVAFEPEATP